MLVSVPVDPDDQGDRILRIFRWRLFVELVQVDDRGVFDHLSFRVKGKRHGASPGGESERGLAGIARKV